MCYYFSKFEDQCSAPMMQAANEAFEKKCNHVETIKTLAKAYTHKRGC